ncbi:MAG TPA: hypothetical protein VGU43_05515 [Thermoplasmata archaeon]|nr:hypothetical protein [Thermoplasmata archaeon]
MSLVRGPWPAPEYRIHYELPAPIGFAYRWCTDYRTDDGRRAGEPYQRKVIRRDRRSVLFEDLWWEPDGWRWRRTEVSLRPPNGWVAHSTGNIRDAEITYRLRPLPNGHSELDLRMRRRPSVWHPTQPRKAPFERDLRRLWRSLARALGREYAKTSRARAPTSRGAPRRRHARK